MGKSEGLHDVCVVGLGYVGLPTACVFASHGFKTVGADLREDIVAQIQGGTSYLSEPEIQSAVAEAVDKGVLEATTDVAGAVRGSRNVIIAVQTPFENGEAQLGFLRKACETVASSILPGTLVALESSVPPGTSAGLVLPIFAAGGHRDGVDFFFAYSPERIAPGNSLREFTDNDRIIGFDVAESGTKAKDLFRSVTRGQVHSTDIVTAETTKLVENTARDVYIAFANELTLMCQKLGVDVWELIRLANTHPRVKILKPGPGVGGPCLTKDPYMLLNAVEGKDSEAGSIIRRAREVNEEMHKEILSIVQTVLRGRHQNPTVAVFGTSYKPGVGDPRASPSESVIHGLIEAGCVVKAYDPYCREAFGGKLCGDPYETAEGADCAVFMVAHDDFKRLELGRLASLMSGRPVMVDAANVLPCDDTSYDGYDVIRLGGRSVGALRAGGHADVKP